MDLIGKRLTYTYANGWRFQTEFREGRISYQVLAGPLAGRIAYQDVQYAQIADDVYQVGWYEETGTAVCLVVNLERRTVNSFAAFPRWLADDPTAAVGRKDEKLEELLTRREAGPDAPREIMFEQAEIGHVDEVTPEPIA